MIRSLLVDDHPALRAGLHSVLKAEPGFTPVAAAASAAEARAELRRWDVDVAIVDYHLPDEDGLSLCWRIRAAGDTPRVLVYSAYADGDLVLPAIAAGADGLASKAAPADELFDAIRLVARGHRVMPAIAPGSIEHRANVLEPIERRLLERLVDEASCDDIAAELELADGELVARRGSIVRKLSLDVP